ncbi:MAG: hypothetical protein K8R92_03385 [Planctomycetes bacterium]|nr:hypothetical protein [Planctomycetota bacterium]
MLKITRPGRLAILALAVTLQLATRATAQDQFGQVPDPLTLGEFKQLVERYIHPDKDHATAIEKLHDAYRERCHALRDNEIAQFLNKKSEQWNNGMPRSKQTEEYTRAYERVLKMMSDADDALFVGVADLVGEGHREGVQRARNARIRECSTGKYMLEYQPITILDITAIMDVMNIPLEAKQKFDPALAAYEQRLTELMKDLAASSIRNRREAAAAAMKAGAGTLSQEERKNDPERARELDAAVQDAMAKAREPFRVKCDKISAFNDAACKTLAAQLPDAYKQWLRNQYFAEAYRRLALGNGGRRIEEFLLTDQLFRKALRSKTLTKPALDQIQAAYQQWQVADEGLVEQGIKDFNAQCAAIDPNQFNMQSEKGMSVLSIELRQKRLELGSNSLKSVSALLDNPKLKALFERDPAQELSSFGNDRYIDQLVDEPKANEPSGWSKQNQLSEQAMSVPLDKAAVDVLVKQLALDESQSTLVQTMHADYLNHCEETLKPTLEKLVAATEGLYPRNKETGNVMPNFDRLNEFGALKTILWQQMTDADTAFFDDLASTLGDQYGVPLKLAKLERVLNRTTRRNFGYTGGHNTFSVTPVNISKLLRSPELSAQEQAQACAAINEQIDPLVATLLESYRTSINLEHERNASDAEFRAHAKPDEIATGRFKPDPEVSRKHQETWASIRLRQRKADRQHMEAIQRAWTTALESLSESQRVSLQLAFDQKSYPTLFESDVSALPFIKGALKLTDLTEEQKSTLQTLKTSTETEHVQLLRKLIPFANDRDNGADIPAPEQDRQREDEFKRVRAKVVVDNDELNQQAVRDLRKVLNDEQAKQVKGLADYENRAAESSRIRKKYGD